MKSWIEISAAGLRHNFQAVQQAAGAAFEVLAVVKADAYGHGAAVCAPVLAEAGARWFGVSDVEEGASVRGALIASGYPDAHILVMCGMEPGDAPGIVEHRLTPVIWTPEQVAALQRAAWASGQPVAVHIELETGMARQGVPVANGEFAKLLGEVARSPQISLEGVFSHLCCSEIRESEHTQAQERRFAAAFETLREAGVRPRFWHLGNSSAVDEGSTLLPTKQQAERLGARAMVRPGLALYGHALPLASETEAAGELRPHLQAVATWKTRVIGVREIAAGDTVGYGATFVANAPMRLALLPAGYADGFRREASSGLGNGWVVIAGRRAPVVGRVSMNLTVVNVTGHEPGVQVGDEVVLLGEGVTAEDHARWCGTISYEILCGMRGHRRLV